MKRIDKCLLKINQPYTLFIKIPLTINDSGCYFTFPLWEKDLALHLDYISHFNLCCPVEHSNDVSGLSDISKLPINEIIPLKRDYGYLSVLMNLIPNFISIIKACRKTSIVHSGAAGWAFPSAYNLILLRPFMNFQWIMVVESSFWMLGKNEKVTPKKLLTHHVNKFLISLCLKSADARIFTQTFYKNIFLDKDAKNTLINPASWVNEDDILKVNDAKQNISQKMLRLIFPTRLIADKGVYLLMDAINKLSNTDIQVNLDIIGDGPLKKDVIEFCNKPHNGVKVQFLETVSYGKPFFDLIREYDAVLVPNIKDEQPRIIFDAFSQGLTVIASNTSGILDTVTHNENAIIFESGDSSALSDAIFNAANSPIKIDKLKRNALDFVQGKTHQQMHQDRLKFLKSVLSI